MLPALKPVAMIVTLIREPRAGSVPFPQNAQQVDDVGVLEVG